METEYIGIIEIGDSVLTIVKEDNKLLAGTTTNCGLITHYYQDYDNDFSLDENLQSFVEKIEEIKENEK